jgi:hypothetical protein
VAPLPPPRRRDSLDATHARIDDAPPSFLSSRNRYRGCKGVRDALIIEGRTKRVTRAPEQSARKPWGTNTGTCRRPRKRTRVVRNERNDKTPRRPIKSTTRVTPHRPPAMRRHPRRSVAFHRGPNDDGPSFAASSPAPSRAPREMVVENREGPARARIVSWKFRAWKFRRCARLLLEIARDYSCDVIYKTIAVSIFLSLSIDARALYVLVTDKSVADRTLLTNRIMVINGE